MSDQQDQELDLATTGKFNPKKHLIQLKGKWYLETKFRIKWFREDHPSGSISTEVISLDPPLVKATIYTADGHVLATGHAGANDKGNAVWSGRSIEKSETAAIGRALACAGYGTQFTGDELDDGQADSGNDPRPSQRPQQPRPAPKSVTSQQASGGDLRDKDTASRFIQRWRAQSLSDGEVLAALGVSKLSEWTRGKDAADAAVNAWLTNQTRQESA